MIHLMGDLPSLVYLWNLNDAPYPEQQGSHQPILTEPYWRRSP
jgi:hypothetical protein